MFSKMLTSRSLGKKPTILRTGLCVRCRVVTGSDDCVGPEVEKRSCRG